MLTELEAIPLRDMIQVENNRLFVDGRQVDYDKAVNLQHSAKALLDNPVRSLIRDQVASIAGRRGIVEGDTPEKLFFYRAAIWWGMTEQELIKALAN